MALSKKAKTWTMILSIPVVLIIAGIIAAKVYFTSERLKALVIPKIEDATHRTVAVNTISLSVFPTLAVSIDGLSISNPPGMFEKNEFLALDNLTLNVKLFELLRNNVEISEIIINHPVIYLEVTKDGKKNFSSGEPPQKGHTVTVETKSSGALLLSNLEINNGEIESVNKKFDSRMRIAGLHQTAHAELRSGENALHFTGESSIEKFSYGTTTSWFLSDQPIKATSKLTYTIDKDVLSLDDVNATLKELPLTMTGTVSRLTSDTLMLDLTVASPGIQMAQLLSLVPPEMLKKAAGLSSSGDVKFTMMIKGPSSETLNPETKGSFTITNGNIQYSGLPKSITNINVAGSFDKPSAPIGAKGIGSFALDKFTASLGSNILSGKLGMKNFDDPVLSASFNGSMNLAEVKDFYPLEQGTDLNGAMKANVMIDGKVKTPESIKANGNIEFHNVTMKSATSTQPLKNLNGTIAFNNQVVESKQLAMNIGESDLNISFTLKNYLGMVMKDAAKTAGKPSATLSLTSKQLRTVDLMGGQVVAANTDAAKQPTTKTIGGSGLLPGIDVDANVTIDKFVTEKFTFNNAKGAVNIANGVINLKNFNVNAFNGTIQSKGMIDLRDPKKSPFNLDLDIKNVESNSLLSNFTSFGKYLFGKFSTTTKLQGDLNDTLGISTSSLLGNGTIDIANGKLLGLPVTEKLAELTNLTDLREVNFNNWTNAFSISNGRFNIKDLKVNAGTTDFLVGGSQGLDGSLDYTMTVKLPESVSNRLNLQGVGGELLQYFKDKDGRVNLPFQVTGVASNPVLRLDTQAQQEMAKKAVQQKLDQGKQKLEDELKKKAEEGLKKLFKKP
jgi:hypothetical protein